MNSDPLLIAAVPKNGFAVACYGAKYGLLAMLFYHANANPRERTRVEGFGVVITGSAVVVGAVEPP
jgi:hypothetical protein